jgi:SAM-dependent methyltransferase
MRLTTHPGTGKIASLFRAFMRRYRLPVQDHTMNRIPQSAYLMEHTEETSRLERKTDPSYVREQARWFGLRPGQRVLDAGCGPGKTSSILHGLVQPGGSVLGADWSGERVRHARERYGRAPGMDFLVHDLNLPLPDAETFDLIWVRFVLEYNRSGSPAIVENLDRCLKPGGTLCLLDLDHNCLNHHPLPEGMEAVIQRLMGVLETHHDFDPYAGRKLYGYLYDLGYEDLKVEMSAHHLIYGQLGETDAYNWLKKMEVTSQKAQGVLEDYPGGKERFFSDFLAFFNDPRRFTYTPIILCKGRKPSSL